MKETRSHLSVLALVIALVGVAFWVGYSTAVHLGLDLKGGLEIVLQAKPTKGQKLTSQDLDNSVKIIRDRVDKLGVAEPEIRLQGSDQIAIELPGISNPDNAVSVVGSTAQLKFYDLSKDMIGSKAYRSRFNALNSAKDRVDKAKAKGKEPEQWYLFDKDHAQIAGPAQTKQELYQDQPGKVAPKGSIALAVPPGEFLVHGAPDKIPVQVETSGKFDRNTGIFLFLKDDCDKGKGKARSCAALTGSEIKQASAESNNGQWVTSILFNGQGAHDFGKVTEQIAQSGALANELHSFAIVLDDEIKSAPTIDYKQYPNGIRGNQAQITGLDNQQEASNLALVLNTGALPVKFEILSKTQVSATLGKDALSQGLKAGAIGLLVVMIYLILFYRFLGLIADIGLIIFSLFFYALIVGIPIVMTLPGIAGMILTIGVAADANIIIFERIREEFRAGRTMKAAIKAGYSKGLRTIVDANVVTLITAFVLFVIGTGTVRGFALLLGIGTVLSMITAVAATYAMLGLLGDLRVFRHPWLIGGNRKPMRFHIPWMKYRNWMFAWTALVLLTCIALIGVKGLNLGVDFKSGTKLDVVLASQDVSVNDVRSAISKVSPEYGKATIVSTSVPNAKKGTKTDRESAFSIQVEKLAKGKRAEQDLRDALDRIGGKTNGGQLEAFNTQTIGPSFGKQIIEGAIFAIIVSLVLEVAYLALRFEVKYALPVLVALVHDLLVAMGAYALTGREFKSATVAALLTILGYSLYDTIIVFDRIRENVRLLRKATFSRIIDASLNEVIMRSINTTLVVLIPIVSLFVFGGETLKDFAYALMIGIFAGAYSSIIIAAPILDWMKEREPAWQRRAAAAAGSRDGGVTRSATTGAVAANGTTLNGEPVNGNGTVEEGEEVGTASAPDQRRRDKRSRAQRKRS